MKYKLLLLLTFTVGIAFTASANIPDIKFQRLDTRDGLSNSQVLCIMRDSRGTVWVGTPYGLNRYDGYRIKTYYSYAKDTTTMRNNYVEEVMEAFDGKLWLKQGMSYSVFDPVTETFERHPERMLQQYGIQGGIERLYIDSQRHFWVKTYDTGFWHYNPYTKKAKNFKFGYGRQEFNPDFGVSSFAEYGKSLLVSSHNGELFCFNRDKDWISWKDGYLRRKGYAHEQDCKLRTDRRGNVWVVTTQAAYIKDARHHRWHHSAHQAFRTWGIDDFPEDVSVWDVCVDAKGRLWIATDHTGLYVVDLRDKEVRQYLNQKYDETTLSDNTLRCIYRDQMGRMWVGTYMNGLNLYTATPSNFVNLELGNINTVCVDTAGYYWLGTNDAGIIRYNPKTTEQLVFDKASHGIGSNTMVGSLAARDGSVWFGTYEGGLIHIKNGSVTNYRVTGEPGTLSNNNIWTVYEDQFGYIWVGTLGSGIQRINPKNGRMDEPISTKNSILPSDYISTITGTKKGWLMVSSSMYYAIVNPKTRKVIKRDITNNPNDVGVTEASICAMQDSRGLSWQGSSSGATIWDPSTNQVYLIDMRAGTFGSTVNGIVEDKNHHIWLSTDHGVSNVVPQQQEDGTWAFVVRSYNSRDGLQNGPYNQRSICYTPSGLVLVGGQGGLDIINPQRMGKGRAREVPVFSGLKLFDREVAVGEKVHGRVVLEEALDQCRTISLRFNDQFTIQLGSTSGEVHNRSRFVYRLDGFNDDWVRTEEVNPNITYMSLRAGTYKLHVRMLNDDGTIGADESTLSITIRPPLWRTRWMILLYMLLIAAAAWLWRKWWLKHQLQRIEVERVRRELEKQQWMNEMRLQLVKEQSEGKSSFQVEQQAIEPQTSVADLVGFVREQCETFKSPVENKSVHVNFISRETLVEADYDASLLGEVFFVLFRNAVTFSASDSVISVGLARVSSQTVQIQVADNGIGIQDEYKEHAFDPIVNGEGIGLDRVKAIIEAHHGTIHIEDNPGGGTIFVIALPTVETIEEAEVMDDEED